MSIRRAAKRPYVPEPTEDSAQPRIVSLLTPSSSILQVWRDMMRPSFLQHYQNFLNRSASCFTCNIYWINLSLTIHSNVSPVDLALKCCLSDNFSSEVVETMKQSASNMAAIVRSLDPSRQHNLGALGGILPAAQLAQLFAALLLLLGQQIDYKIALLVLEPHVSKARDEEKWEQGGQLHALRLFVTRAFLEIGVRYRVLQGKSAPSSRATFIISSISSTDSAIQRLLLKALSVGELLTIHSVEALVEENPWIVDQVGRGRIIYLVPSFSGIPYKLAFGQHYENSDYDELNLLPLVSFMPNYREMLKNLVIRHICSRCIE
ncbi:hypothetical protein CLAVI_000300 [Candidatus Clavichlamydia salmonicola]|uniref:hypothetical protein n=1 Tax=Candidatus Clavichlamydia salmonicola TaxID=469812 RepID=UPI0018917A06|nr:hypothetical protein [Candidatus Clavichlamydia salmonicola]MBF5050685.1 hypothetical protein [Candidatus Clavichlamydia salmonicola]